MKIPDWVLNLVGTLIITAGAAVALALLVAVAVAATTAYRSVMTWLDTRRRTRRALATMHLYAGPARFRHAPATRAPWLPTTDAQRLIARGTFGSMNRGRLPAGRGDR